MASKYPLEVLDEREIIRMGVARSLYHQSRAVVGRFIESHHSCSVHQAPKPRRIKIDHGSGEVHCRVVVEQTASREADDRLSNCALPRRRRSVEEEDVHRLFLPCLVRLTDRM